MNKRLIDQDSNNARIALMSAVICFCLLMGVYCVILEHDINEFKERYSYIAKNEAEHIATTVDCVMSRTNTLKTMVQDHNGDTSWFNNVAEDIYESVQDETGISLKNFAIAPNGVVSDVYPLEGNESLIGFDFLDTSRTGNLEAKEAYEKGETILTNPFNLIQGGVGIGGRAPVMMRDDESGVPWGLVTVTIDFDNLIEVLALDNLQGMGVDYSLSYIDADGKAQFMHGDSNLGGNTVNTQFEVRNLTWEIEVKPIKGWISVWQVALSMIIVIGFSAFAGLLTYMVLQLRERNVVLLRMSITDTLTGCCNRRAYEDKVREIAENGIDDDFVFVSADVNDLKSVNDTLGHQAGDELLTGAAQCLKKVFGQYGEVYRIGGDEFAILINADEKILTEIKDKVHFVVDEWKGSSVDGLSISFGYAAHREFPDMTVEELNSTADRFMYDEKDEYYIDHPRSR